MKKPLKVVLLRPPEGLEPIRFMRSFINNTGARIFRNGNVVGYINRADKIGILGDYEPGTSVPFRREDEMAAIEFLKVLAKDPAYHGFAWVVENRGAFGPWFLKYIFESTQVIKKPPLTDPKFH